MADTSVVLPGDTFQARHLMIQTLPAGTRVFRVTKGEYAVSPPPFRPLEGTAPKPDHRFHSPAGLYRIAYFGLEEEAAFVESQFRGPTRRKTLPTRPDLFLVDFEIGVDLQVVLLARQGLPIAGATTGSLTGPYEVSSAWGEAVFRREERFEGLIYPSTRASHLECLAIFDRTDTSQVFRHRGARELRMDERPLRDWAAEYRIGWIRSG